MTNKAADNSSDNIIIDYGNGNIFDAEQAINFTVDWIRDFFDETGGKIAVIGISGGKDSSVVAALCARALSPENVIGVKMSDGGQDDWRDQDELISHLGIRHIDFDIGDVTQAMRDTAADVLIAVPGWHNESYNDVPENMWDTPEVNRENAEKADREGDSGIFVNAYELPRQAAINMPARIRMTVLYMIAQSLRDSARVINTCNLSENYIGWSTRWGDSVGDCSPVENYTASEVIAIGRVLGLPAHLVEKAPSDGLSGATDEDNFGFTYEQLDDYIRRGRYSTIPEDIREKIDRMHACNEFKMHMPPACPSGLDILAPRVGEAAIENSAGTVENDSTCEESQSLSNLFKNAHVIEFEPSSNPGMDVTIEDNIDLRDLMAPCPNCHNTDSLSIKCDLASLNALDYWVECSGCGEHWTDRMLGTGYVKTKEELLELWNKNMSA